MSVRAAATFVRSIDCSACGTPHDPARLLTVCRGCGGVLLVRYDLERVAAAVAPGAWASRPLTMYRYRELLPLDAREEPVSLGEGGTPLLPLPRLGQRLGLTHLLGKDEGRNPTGTFKARGLSLAVTRARGFGVRGLILPSAGNAGGAAAAYGARAGLPVAVVVPRETPEAAIDEALLAGARVFTVEGTLSLAGQVAARAAAALGFLDLATLKEPFRLEGKKTMGLELAEQLGWRAPDLVVYPTGGGTGLIGIWKAFQELIALGWVAGKGPRLIAVQATGCAPVVHAWRQGVETDASSRVLHFTEKPKPEEVTSNMVNAGAWLVEPEVMSRIPPETQISFERTVFPEMLARHEPVYAYTSHGYWMDAGTPERYLLLHRDLLSGKSKQYIPARGLVGGEYTDIAPTAKVTGQVVIGANCSIGARVKITGPAVIGAGSAILADSVIEYSVIWKNVRIESGVHLKESIVADSCHLISGSRGETVVLGANVTVPGNCLLETGSRIKPGTVANTKPAS